MRTTVAGPVIVGIGVDFHGQRAALRFAAQEASRRRTRVRLVHGCEPPVTLVRAPTALPLGERQRHARHVLWAAARHFDGLTGQRLRVDKAVYPGTAIEALLEESSGAAVVVLQRRDITPLQHFATGSTTSTVAAQATSPVAVVRSNHAAADDRSGVVVGVDRVGHAGEALTVAFQEAALRRTRLIAVHGWRAAGRKPGCGPVPTGDEVVRDRQEVTESLAALMATYTHLYPQVRPGAAWWTLGRYSPC